MENSTQYVHGTTVEIEGFGVILLGESGVGKSDLALRLMDHGALLVSDDQTIVSLHKGTIWASAPKTIQGQIEIRQIGVQHVPFVKQSPLFFAVQLTLDCVDRMPERQILSYFEKELPLYHLHPHEASTPAKIRFLVEQLNREKYAA